RLSSDTINIIPGNIRPGRALSVIGAARLEEKDLETVLRVDGVENVYASLRSIAKVRYGNEEISLSVVGIENPDSWAEIEAERLGLEEGKFISREEKYSAVVGYSIAYEIFSKDLSVGKKIEIEGRIFKVSGILKKAGGILASVDQYIYIPIDSAREIFGEKFTENEYSIIVAKVSRGYDVESVAEEIEEALLKERKENEETKSFTVISPRFFQETVGSVLGTLTLFLSAIAGISLLVGGIGIANIMYVSVMERTKDIGIMKAIGATSKTILLLFLLESGLIGLFGGILGSAFGIIFSYVLSFAVSLAFATERMAMSIIIQPQTILMGCFFGFLVGLLAGFLPARKASKLNPVDALRYE
ncbi:MAG: ABC transporter permease, partial [Candidatus Aenigmatarchaeota archaeon]